MVAAEEKCSNRLLYQTELLEIKGVQLFFFIVTNSYIRTVVEIRSMLFALLCKAIYNTSGNVQCGRSVCAIDGHIVFILLACSNK